MLVKYFEKITNMILMLTKSKLSVKGKDKIYIDIIHLSRKYELQNQEVKRKTHVFSIFYAINKYCIFKLSDKHMSREIAKMSCF